MSQSDRVSVPFRLEDYALDLASSTQTDGVLRLEGDDLILEFRLTTTSMRTLKSESGDVREARIPLADIESMEVSRRWPWGAKLRIRTRTLLAMQNVFGAKGNQFVVPVRRADYDRARVLCVNVALELSGRELRRLEADTDG